MQHKKQKSIPHDSPKQPVSRITPYALCITQSIPLVFWMMILFSELAFTQQNSNTKIWNEFVQALKAGNITSEKAGWQLEIRYEGEDRVGFYFGRE